MSHFFPLGPNEPNCSCEKQHISLIVMRNVNSSQHQQTSPDVCVISCTDMEISADWLETEKHQHEHNFQTEHKLIRTLPVLCLEL